MIDTNVDDSPTSSGIANINSEGDVPRKRFRDAKHANSFSNDRWDADRQAAVSRALVDDMIDGQPPFDQSDLRASAQGTNININFQRAFAKVEQSLASYNDLANSDEFLITCESNVGTVMERERDAQIYQAEYTRLLRFKWTDFVPRLQMLGNLFIRQGVAIAFRPNEFDWRFSVSRLGDFQVDRRSGCSVDDFECAVWREELPPVNVYDWVEDPKVAKAAGWNVKATRKAISDATVYDNTKDWNWEQVERDMKDNGLFWTKGRDPRVELRHFITKQFDGKLSHQITSPTNDEDFLFQREGRWNKPSDYLTLFTYGIGNGDLYSIRGLGYKIFAIEQLYNILMSRAGDSTLRSMSFLWTAQTPDQLQEAMQIVWGSDTFVPAGISPVQITPQNIGQNILPYVNLIANQESLNTGTYTSTEQIIGGNSPERKSATQASIEANQQAILTTSAKVLFMQSLDRVHTMVSGAITKPHYPRNMPGGELRWEMFRRCMDAGMSEKAFHSIDCVRAVRPIGLGSAIEQQQKMGALMQIFGMLDPIAQKIMLRKIVGTQLGSDYIEVLVPMEDRVPIDAKQAELEANSFINGITPQVMPEEEDSVHLDQHFRFMAATLAKLEQQQIQPQEVLEIFSASIPHCQAHLQKMGANPAKKKETSEAAQVLQKFVMSATQIGQNLQQQQQAEAEATRVATEKLESEALNQRRENEKAAAEIERKNAIAQAEIERKQDLAEAEIEINQTKAASEIRTEQAIASSQIQSKEVESRVSVGMKARKARQEMAIKDLETSSKLSQQP